jgi:primary-amine oxidase
LVESLSIVGFLLNSDIVSFIEPELPGQPYSPYTSFKMTSLKPQAMPHPLQPLSEEEILKARNILSKKHSSETNLFFRSAYLEEPSRDDLVKFLAAEHGHHDKDLASSLPRLVKFIYDAIKGPGNYQLTDTVVDINAGEIVHHEEHPSDCQTSYTM